MTKVVIITSVPAPYRVAHYKYLQEKYKDYEFYIIFLNTRSQSKLRQWDNSTEGLNNVTFLPRFTLVFNRKYDVRQIIITHGIKKTLNQISPNVVVCMEYNTTALQTMSWCKRKNIPFISLTDGTLHSERNIGKVQKISRKYIMKNADAFIASSTKAKEKIESYKPKTPIYTSLLTVDIDQYLYEKRENQDSGQLIYVGSLIERKGIDLLFDALSTVKREYHLRIVGSGPLEDEVRNQARQLGIDNRIEFCGYKQRDELVELYKQANFFVLPTREDCYGLVILEAMCASMPVLTSKYADGAYDIINPGINGQIVDPYDKEEFGKAIEDMIDKTAENNVMGIEAYKRAHDFSFDKVSIGFMEAIRYVLDRR